MDDYWNSDEFAEASIPFFNAVNEYMRTEDLGKVVLGAGSDERNVILEITIRRIEMEKFYEINLDA